VELLVDRERQRVEHHDLVLDQDRHCGSAVVGCLRHHQVYFVGIQQLRVDAGLQRRITLVVVMDELHRPL
jgi:hypothetical protein